MKILVIHNRYREAGGEDAVVDSEANMLRSYGHTVLLYERSNREIGALPFFKKIYFFVKNIIWSARSYDEVKELIKKEKPDLAHIHNIFFMVTPSVYQILAQEGIPIVHSWHNYRMFCPIGIFYRRGKVCEECIGKKFIHALIHRCFKGSFILTALLVRMLTDHWKRDVFRTYITAYIVSSEFSKKKFIEGGVPAEKIFIKPNFSNFKVENHNRHGYILFMGRLCDYKGVFTLIDACRKAQGIALKIVGDGPLYDEVAEKTAGLRDIELLGRLSDNEKNRWLKGASFLVFPSECYENMPMVMIESLACGVPVIASRLGAMEEMIQEGVTGMLFEAGNSDDLADKIKYLCGNGDLLAKMSENARKAYEEKYTQQVNYRMLMAVYEAAAKTKSKIYS